ncbi:MAG: preprotein translocase subunit YajC [Planctomycetota bacterium]|nr:MAG: preprotein translocase subunit YajC [Planctomycetota bacterium]
MLSLLPSITADAEPAPQPPAGEGRVAPAEGAKAAPSAGQETTTGTQVPGGAKNNGGKEPPSGAGMQIIFMIGIFLVIIYFFMWRPQKKQKEERKQLMSSLKKNDKVVTIGGIHGTVHQVRAEENKVVVRVDDKTNMTFSISAIHEINPKKAEDKRV